MLKRLIDEINTALEHDCYFAALALALTLPDICGKAEYPEAGVTKRYIDWYNETVRYTQKCPSIHNQETSMPYLSGEVVYNLRNSFLHQGNPNIEVEKIHAEENKVDQFTLRLQEKNQFDIYADAASVTETFAGNQSLGKEKRYTVNVRRLCMILTRCAEGYYNEFPEKFVFFNYHIEER